MYSLFFISRIFILFDNQIHLIYIFDEGQETILIFKHEIITEETIILNRFPMGDEYDSESFGYVK